MTPKETRTIYLVFNTDQNKTHTLTINNTDETYTEADVKALMDNIITNELINGKNGKAISKKSARYVLRQETEINIA